MKKVVAFLFFILTICSSAFAQSPLPELDKVREIKLLESTREDVRRILADYTLDDSQNYYEEFSTKNVYIKIDYSRGNCAEKEGEEWNVPEWTVTDTEISPKGSIEPEDIRIDYSKFRKEKVYKNISQYIYHDKNAGIAVEFREKDFRTIYLFPSRNKFPLLCADEKTRKRFLSKSWFDTPLKERWISIDYNQPADVVDLRLSGTEIIADCISPDSNQSKSCLGDVSQVSVITEAFDPENDVLTYNYEISAGKIIGQGYKVVWDLSGVSPGTYKITAGVDDSCGICGKTVTKTVVVKECSDCKVK